jgi:uncharacterized membrane protein
VARAESSLVINRPIDAVFAYLADIAKGMEWQSELLEVQQTSDGPVGIGTNLREIRRLLGRNMETSFTITDFDPESKLGFKSTSGPIPMRAYYSLESVSPEGVNQEGSVDATRVNMTVEAELTGIFKMTEPLVVHSAKRQMDADIAKLKEILEAGN